MVTVRSSSYTSTATGYSWLAGDTHRDNFGAEQDRTGNGVFSVDEFDQGHLGQYVWDRRRAAVSVVLAGQESRLSSSQITTAINAFLAAYVMQMSSFAGGNGEATFQLTSSNISSVVKTRLPLRPALPSRVLVQVHLHQQGRAHVPAPFDPGHGQQLHPDRSQRQALCGELLHGRRYSPENWRRLRLRLRQAGQASLLGCDRRSNHIEQ